MKKRYDAIYARQSVDKKDSVSIEAQIEKCKRECGKDFLEYKDKGFSGKNTLRPDLTKLMKDIEAGIVKKVVVYKLDRISRNIKDFHNLYAFMEEHDCSFVSVEEKFDTSNSIGRAMMNILAVFAQMERENIQQRIKDNYYFRIKDNRWASGKAPFGFQNGKVNGKTSLIPVKKEIDVVKWMFKTYATKANVSLGQLQKELISKGIKGHQSENGFARTTLMRILSSPVYAVADEYLYQYYLSKKIDFANDAEMWNGEFSAALVGKKNRSIRSKDVSGMTVYITNVKGVIDSHTFIIVQDRLAQNSQIASDNQPKHALKELSGLIKCSCCGSAVKMQAYPTLVCSGRSQRRICNVSFSGLRLEDIQDVVCKEVQKHFATLQKSFDVAMKKKSKEQADIDKLKKQLDNLVNVASYSENTADAVAKQIDAIQTKIYDKQLKMKLHFDSRDLIELRTQLNRFVIDKSGKANLVYKDLDTAKRQTVLRILVKKILLSASGDVEIVWKE